MTNITTTTFPAVVFSVTDAGIAELEAKPQRENARLIAAAPELLAIAREILNNPDSCSAYLHNMAVHAVGKATT